MQMVYQKEYETLYMTDKLVHIIQTYNMKEI